MAQDADFYLVYPATAVDVLDIARTFIA